MGVCHAVAMAVFQAGAAPQWAVCSSRPPKVRKFDYDTQIDLMIHFENGITAVVQGNIDIQCANMRLINLIKNQPGNRSPDHNHPIAVFIQQTS